MNRYRVNTADIVREKIAAGDIPEELADRIQDDQEEKKPSYKIIIFLFTGRKRTK